MERRSMRSSTSPTTGCIRPSATDAIAWSSLFQLGDQPIDSPRERGDFALRDIVSELRAPLFVQRPEFLHERAPAARELHARRTQVLRIFGALGETELFEPRDHPSHVLFRHHQ